MPYRRSAPWASNSFGSSTSGSPSPGGVSSPLAAVAALACPDIAEDDEEELRPPSIEIGDAQTDDAPFDPSLPDELYWKMRQAADAAAAAQAESASASASMHERLARLMGAHKPPKSVPPPATSVPAASSRASLQSSGSRRSRFRLRRGSSGEESLAPSVPDVGELPEEEQRELATLISCTKGPRFSLIPLDVAQAREAIVRHPEGFELEEAKRAQKGL